MKIRVIVMLFIALFTIAGAGSSKAGEIKKVKSGNSKIAVIPRPDKARVFQQGRHRWHRMHGRRHRHEPVRRHHMRRMHHRESRHYRR